jgi:hypothetical protein
MPEQFGIYSRTLSQKVSPHLRLQNGRPIRATNATFTIDSCCDTIATMASQTYRFTMQAKYFPGKTMEHAMLRSAPRLYRVADWAKRAVSDKPNLRPLLEEFRRLRKLLWCASVAVTCQRNKCKRTVRYMSFAPDWVEGYLRPGAHFWCRKHEPRRGPEEDGESELIPLHFDALTEHEHKKSQKAIHLAILEGLGIDKKPTRITEKFARKYFAKLSQEKSN